MAYLLAAAFVGLLLLAGAVLAVVLLRRKRPEPYGEDFAAPPTPPAAPAKPIAQAEPAEPTVPVVAPPPAPEPVVAPQPVAEPVAEPVAAPQPVAEPVAEPEAVPEPQPVAAPAPPAPVPFTHLQKARIGGVDLVMWAQGASFVVDGGPVAVTAFTTEGFAAKGREELVLYLRARPGDGDDVVRGGLKVLSSLALAALDRPEDARWRAGDVVSVPGAIAEAAFAGFRLLAPCEPQPVPLPDARLVVVGLTAEALAAGGEAGWLTERP